MDREHSAWIADELRDLTRRHRQATIAAGRNPDTQTRAPQALTELLRRS